MIGALTVAWTNQELQKCKEGKPYTFYKQEEKSFPYDCCKVDWNTIQRGNNHLMKFIYFTSKTYYQAYRGYCGAVTHEVDRKESLSSA